MKKILLASLLFMAATAIIGAQYNSIIHFAQGGEDFTAESGGTVTIASGASLVVANGATFTAASIAVSGATQMASKTAAAIKLLTPSAVGQEYYCNDCATVAKCVSTGTATGAFALITNKGSACQ